MSSGQAPVFVIGAGFNLDAPAAVGPILGGPSLWGQMVPIDAPYPLVRDLWRICFSEPSPPAGVSIEERFDEALRTRNYLPLRNLSETLMKADYYVAGRLARQQSYYSAFFEAFPTATYLTFNYDSLIEIFLHQRRRWYPEDGFGLPVAVARTAAQSSVTSEPIARSTSQVLHLHGSLCVYAQTAEYINRPSAPHSTLIEIVPSSPRFHFEPESIGPLFPDYRSSLTLAYVPIEQRIVAPVPDKSKGLTREFVQAVYQRAAEVITASNHLVVVGYSFNAHDKTSYDPILRQARGKQISVVAPDADQAVLRLKGRYAGISWSAANQTFKDWALSGFPSAHTPS